MNNPFLLESSIFSLDTTYKYRELCSILGEDVKRGNAKKSQLRRWSRLFRWENPTSHTYRILEVYDTPREAHDGRRNNGGARAGSGARPKVQEEFDYLFNAFLHREFNRNAYNGRSEICQSYFFNGEISRYFGMYSDRFYDAAYDLRDDPDALEAWSDIGRKITEKRKSWIYNKIDKMDGVTLQNGIIAHVSQGLVEHRDDLLDEWERRMREYVRGKGMRTIADVAERGLWEDMIAFISDGFEGYERVERAKRITFDVTLLRDYDWNEYEEHRRRLNDKLVTELLRYFGKRVDDDGMKTYRYIIETYVRI